MSSPPRTKQSYVYVSLRDDIQSGRLKPGSRLTLTDLQDRFGVSHIPIREALRNLEKEGFIELNPHASAQVKSLSIQEALWIAQLRIMLEPLAVSQAVEHLSTRDIEEIEMLVTELETVVESGDVTEYFALNYQLHKRLFSCTPNQHLARITNELAEMINRYNTNSGKPGVMRIWQGEHKDLLEAVKAGDSNGAERLMRQHLSHMVDLLEKDRRNLAEPNNKQLR